jgi:hypothetical protein
MWGRTLLLRLIFELISPLEAFYLPRCVHDALLPSEKGVTLATKLDLQRRLSRADGEGIAARAGNLRLRVIFGMDLFLHR